MFSEGSDSCSKTSVALMMYWQTTIKTGYYIYSRLPRASLFRNILRGLLLLCLFHLEICNCFLCILQFC
jgi:hypothetical protein